MKSEWKWCQGCSKMVKCDQKVHAFMEHQWKMLECKGCDYQHIVVDSFRRHLHEKHPELPQDWEEYLVRAEQPFLKVKPCPANYCEFRTCQVRDVALTHHQSKVHGLKPLMSVSLNEPPVHQPFVEVAQLPLSLFEHAEKYSTRFIGRIESVKPLVALLKSAVRTGVYSVSLEGNKIGTLLIELHPSRSCFVAEENKQHFKWPRSRVELLDTYSSPWEMAFCIFSKIIFEVGDHKINHVKYPSLEMVLSVHEENYN